MHRRAPHLNAMRVAIITESFPPDINGVAHSVVRVAEHLVASGHEPLVIAPEPASGTARVAGHLPYPVVRVPSMPMPGYPSFRLGLPSRKLTEALLGHGTELVHLASPFFLGARRSALPGAVFLGPRQGRQLARLYASLDVFVHSGPYETFGQTVQEAAASGVPVVAPAAGGPVDLVADGVTGYLVPPLSAQALDDAVGRLVESARLRKEFGAAAREMVRSR